MVRHVVSEPRHQFVSSSIGYLSFFPMFLKVLPPSSPKLVLLLDKLSDPAFLWTPRGLRSLSRTSPLFEKANTDMDPPYWRGAIWSNVNYLAIDSLRYVCCASSYLASLQAPNNLSRLELLAQLNASFDEPSNRLAPLERYSATRTSWFRFPAVTPSHWGSQRTNFHFHASNTMLGSSHPGDENRKISAFSVQFLELFSIGKKRDTFNS